MDRDIRLFLVVVVLFAFLFGMVAGAVLGRWRFEEAPIEEPAGIERSLEEVVALEDVTLESNILLEETAIKRVCVAVKDTTSSAVFGAIEVGDPALEDVTAFGCMAYDHSIIIGECNTISLLETSYVLIVHVDSINIEKILTEEEFELISQILIAVNKVNKTSNEAYIGRHEMTKLKE